MAKTVFGVEVMANEKLRYFYHLYYKESGEFGSFFDLGYFSTMRNLRFKIDLALKMPGFLDRNCFRIMKIGVRLPENTDKRNVNLYIIEHEYTIKENDEYVDFYTLFGIFPSKQQANEKVSHLKAHSLIGRKYPQNFIVSRVIVDNYNDWSEGFAKY